MPITWTPENEAKMLAAIFQICEIKLSEAQKREVAGMMGDGCTPKAISHRLQKLKAAGTSALQAFNDGEAVPKAKRVKTSAPIRAGKKKKAAAEYEDDEEAFQTPPASAKGKKRDAGGVVKMEEVEEDEGEGEGIEVGEDIGEGLRAAL